MSAGRFRPGVSGRAAALTVALALAACTPGPLASPGPDASTAAATCATLARVGCPLGADPACASRVQLAITEQRVKAGDIACARAATTKGALADCSPYFACP